MFDFENIPLLPNGMDLYSDTSWVYIDLKTKKAETLKVFPKYSCEDFLEKTKDVSDDKVIILVPVSNDYQVNIYRVNVSTQREKVIKFATSRYKTFVYGK